MKIHPYGIHWFRRDLRLKDNPALSKNIERHHGRVLGFFCFDPDFLSRPDFSANRFGFFLETLAKLKEEIQGKGGDLWVLNRKPFEAFFFLLKTLGEKKIEAPSLISWNRDYEPFARNRDNAMMQFFRDQQINYETERDHLLLEPQEVLKPNDRSHYKVYSPFARQWMKLLQEKEFASRLRVQGVSPDFKLKWEDLFSNSFLKEHDRLEETRYSNSKKVTVPLPTAGHQAAIKQLEKFKHRLDEYACDRDKPAVEGTSKMSIYLKNGSITCAQVISHLKIKSFQFSSDAGAVKFLKELIWREFYYSILYHCPWVEYEAFSPRFRNIQWVCSDQLFDAWKNGETGFPIVDAGMRELQKTGWMHNRVRMIVASFLVKDLHIDWRRGEQHFMQQLLDGDLASNNGGWQWVASTGADPQPYFRIFNPWLQSKKFDPEGVYIKKHIPELQKIDAKDLHEPHAIERFYLTQIISHAEQKEKTKWMYA